MGPLTQDERHLLLGRITKDLNRLRWDAQKAGCDFPGLPLANAEDEAQTPLEKLEGGLFPEEE